MNELAIIETLTPAVFTEEGKLETVIKDIESRVANFNGDVTTPKGREEIKSFAFRIAKSKTALDNLGKECVEDWKKLSKAVDAKRRFAWEKLEAYQHQVRKPVTDWEEAEENRINALKERVHLLTIPTALSSDTATLHGLLANIEAIEIDESFQEMADIAKITKEATVSFLEKEIVEAEKREADAAELVKLRQEAAIRAQQERDEAIRKEAADKATKEAEEKAKAEREATERREAEVKLEAERKEHEAKLAAEKAEKEAEEKIQAERNAAAKKELELKLEAEKAQREKIEAEQKAARAVEAERERVAAENARVAAEEAKREANKRHRASIHKKASDAFKLAGLSAEQAEIALNAICQGLVPNITISY